ncbi:MAG TPA: hypothetical protein DGR97_08525 [Gammaproteobacteria bacterium]|nr:hypothetical protein [Gammaproteobacteria bacterium]|tara:strand:+ start:1619 stop:2017 length:399 start_codon:yes stop_codon:yes gene_type:complete
MSEDFNLSWLGEFQKKANADRELGIVGEWFSTTFSVSFGSTRVAFKIANGRVEEIMHDPRFDVRAIFGFSAPREVWQKFFAQTPPPLYHDLFAMIMRIKEFVIEGDSLVAMQNARALHRMMLLMREAGIGNV